MRLVDVSMSHGGRDECSMPTVPGRAGTNTPSDEYDLYREYRVANTNMYSRIHFFSEAKLGNGLSVLVYACIMYSAQKFHFAYLPCIWENQRISKPLTYTWLEGLRSPQHSYP